MKKFNYVLLTAVMVLTLLLAACGATPEPTQAPQPTEAPPASEPTEAMESEGVSLATILTGPHDDNSWNEAAWNAKEALAAKGVEVTSSESIAEGDVARVLREYAEQGFDMIVAHSFGYQDGVFEVAQEYPDVNFAWAGGIQRTAENVADYDQPFYEAAYPIGIIAGYMSESGVLGAVYGFDIPVCHAMGEAFLMGAQSVNPDAQLIVTATGEWVDVAKNKEAALAQADAGVDFWLECGEGSALGAIEAAKEAGGYVTGYVGDMTENGPDVVLVNLMWDLEPLFEQMLEDTAAGTFDNPWYVPGVAEGSMLYTYNEGLKDQIPEEAIQAAAEAFEAIKNGEFEVPYIPEAGAEPPPEEAPSASLATILTGPHDDNSWNEAAWNAKEALAAKGVEVTSSESIAEGDVARVLREYAEQGFDMIVAHSFGYQDGVFEVAQEYPDVNFAWAGGIQRTAENVADYDQPFYEAAYPIGIIAGYMSESGVLGAVYGFDIPVCHAMGEAFLMGAQSVNPDAQLIVTATGEWVDVAKNKEAALAQADAGVDFWLECGEGSALGAIEAAKEAGGYVTGYVGDMTENGPDVVLVNLMWDLEPLFEQMLEDTAAGTFDNPWYVPGVAEGSMLYTYNEGLKDQIPEEAIQAAAEAFEAIKNGEFEVPYIPEAQE